MRIEPPTGIYSIAISRSSTSRQSRRFSNLKAGRRQLIEQLSELRRYFCDFRPVAYQCLLMLENQRHREVDSPLPAYRRRARRKRTHRAEANLPQPAIEILAHERVIGKFGIAGAHRSEEHTSELQSLRHLVC